MDEVDRVLLILHLIIRTIFATAKEKDPRHIPYKDLQFKQILFIIFGFLRETD